MKKIFYYSFIIISLISCGKKNDLNLVKTDLLQYGLPISIHVPQDATFSPLDMGGLKEVTIADSTSFFGVWAYATPISTSNVTQYKAERLATEKNRPTFTKLIREDRDGFIYESQLDEQTVSFQFAYFIIAGDKYYTLENIGTAILTKEQAIAIYDAIRN